VSDEHTNRLYNIPANICSGYDNFNYWRVIVINWGLFLGCKVFCKEHKKNISDGIGVLVGITPDDEDADRHILKVFYEKGRWNIYKDCEADNCKPILRPLSNMTDKEKNEFENVMMCGFKFKEVYLYDINKGLPNHKKQWIILAKTIVGSELYVNSPDQIIWLMSKSFYVGQCEENECIMQDNK